MGRGGELYHCLVKIIIKVMVFPILEVHGAFRVI